MRQNTIYEFSPLQLSTLATPLAIMALRYVSRIEIRVEIFCMQTRSYASFFDNAIKLNPVKCDIIFQVRSYKENIYNGKAQDIKNT